MEDYQLTTGKQRALDHDRKGRMTLPTEPGTLAPLPRPPSLTHGLWSTPMHAGIAFPVEAMTIADDVKRKAIIAKIEEIGLAVVDLKMHKLEDRTPNKCSYHIEFDLTSQFHTRNLKLARIIPLPGTTVQGKFLPFNSFLGYFAICNVCLEEKAYGCGCPSSSAAGPSRKRPANKESFMSKLHRFN